MTLWERNGGIYLGRHVVPPLSLDEEAQLAAKRAKGKDDLNPLLPTQDEPLRGEWRETDEEIRYEGDKRPRDLAATFRPLETAVRPYM